MNPESILDFCSRASFETLRVWYMASGHVHMLDAINRVYGSREARAWLAGKLLLERQGEFRARHFQPNPNTRIPDYTKGDVV